MSTILQSPSTTQFPMAYDSLSKLPRKLLLNILHYLNLKKAQKLSLCNKRLHRIYNSSETWQSFFFRDCKSEFAKNKPQDVTWKTFYSAVRKFPIPYPGNSGVFKVEKGKDWRVRYSPPVVREFSLINIADNPLFRKFQILGNRSGSVVLSVEFLCENELIYTYFKKINVSFGKSQMHGSFIYIHEHQSIKNLWTVVKGHNACPKKIQLLIDKIIKTNDWKRITPLTKKERKSLLETDKVIEDNKKKGKFTACCIVTSG